MLRLLMVANKTSINEEIIEEEYHVSWYIVAYKMLFGVVEFLLGLGIAIFGRAALYWYEIYKVRELAEDPHDLIIRFTREIVPGVLTHNLFLIIYLIILGGAKIAGAIGLIYKKNWGVDLLVALTIIMLPFQSVQLLIHPSFPDFLYIMLGLVIALYLVNFQPHKWAIKMVGKVRLHPKNTISTS